MLSCDWLISYLCNKQLEGGSNKWVSECDISRTVETTKNCELSLHDFLFVFCFFIGTCNSVSVGSGHHKAQSKAWDPPKKTWLLQHSLGTFASLNINNSCSVEGGQKSKTSNFNPTLDFYTSPFRRETSE